MNLQPIIDAIAHVIQDNPVGFGWFCIVCLLCGFWVTLTEIYKFKP